MLAGPRTFHLRSEDGSRSLDSTLPSGLIWIPYLVSSEVPYRARYHVSSEVPFGKIIKIASPGAAGFKGLMGGFDDGSARKVAPEARGVTGVRAPKNGSLTLTLVML